MLKEYLAQATTAAEYAARWWACYLNNPNFEYSSKPETNNKWPPIDEPSEDNLIDFANQLKIIIEVGLTKLASDGSIGINGSSAQLLLWAERRTPCDTLSLAANKSGVFIPWWVWPVEMKMQVSSFHVEILRANSSHWEPRWGTKPVIVVTEETPADPTKRTRGIFGD